MGNQLQILGTLWGNILGEFCREDLRKEPVMAYVELLFQHEVEMEGTPQET
jgi:hypothetical protein